MTAGERWSLKRPTLDDRASRDPCRRDARGFDALRSTRSAPRRTEHDPTERALPSRPRRRGGPARRLPARRGGALPRPQDRARPHVGDAGQRHRRAARDGRRRPAPRRAERRGRPLLEAAEGLDRGTHPGKHALRHHRAPRLRAEGGRVGGGAARPRRRRARQREPLARADRPATARRRGARRRAEARQGRPPARSRSTTSRARGRRRPASWPASPSRAGTPGS